MREPELTPNLKTKQLSMNATGKGFQQSKIQPQDSKKLLSLSHPIKYQVNHILRGRSARTIGDYTILLNLERDK